MYQIYILKSKKTGIHYVGYTGDLNQRLKAHNSGKTKSLKRHIPLKVLYTEDYKFLEDAIKRERQIKSYKSGEALKKLLKTDII